MCVRLVHAGVKKASSTSLRHPGFAHPRIPDTAVAWRGGRSRRRRTGPAPFGVKRVAARPAEPPSSAAGTRASSRRRTRSSAHGRNVRRRRTSDCANSGRRQTPIAPGATPRHSCQTIPSIRRRRKVRVGRARSRRSTIPGANPRIAKAGLTPGDPEDADRDAEHQRQSRQDRQEAAEHERDRTSRRIENRAEVRMPSTRCFRTAITNPRIYSLIVAEGGSPGFRPRSRSLLRNLRAHRVLSHRHHPPLPPRELRREDHRVGLERFSRAGQHREWGYSCGSPAPGIA